jgi:hypothetical protein
VASEFVIGVLNVEAAAGVGGAPLGVSRGAAAVAAVAAGTASPVAAGAAIAAVAANTTVGVKV